jgi:hypothetical protein
MYESLYFIKIKNTAVLQLGGTVHKFVTSIAKGTMQEKEVTNSFYFQVGVVKFVMSCILTMEL